MPSVPPDAEIQLVLICLSDRVPLHLLQQAARIPLLFSIPSHSIEQLPCWKGGVQPQGPLLLRDVSSCPGQHPLFWGKSRKFPSTPSVKWASAGVRQLQCQNQPFLELLFKINK